MTLTSNLNYFQQDIPQRKGKQYTTKEECLKENGEHVLSESFDPSPGISCTVMHYDGVCDWHTPTRICFHCPYSETLITKQKELKEWKENSGLSRSEGSGKR